MNCILCQKSLDLFDPAVTTIQFETHNGNPVLNRVFNLCEKCAYGVLEQFVKADPMCKRCEADESKE